MTTPALGGPSLDLAGVVDVLAHRAYRPGWTFTAYVGDTTRAVIVQIEATVENSYAPGAQVPLDIRCPVPGYALDGELAFDKWLAHRLQVVEVHESQEWFRRPSVHGGATWVPVFNPHRDGADRDQWPIVRSAPVKGASA